VKIPVTHGGGNWGFSPVIPNPLLPQARATTDPRAALLAAVAA
jgi:hypothetical protein